MENPETLKDNVEDYIETRIDIIKLKIIDKVGSAMSGAIVGIATAFLALIILLFLSFSAAFAIAEVTNRNSIGFLAVAGFYILLAVLLTVLKEKLVTMPIINALLKKFYFQSASD